MSEHIYWQDDSGLYKREEIVRCRDCAYLETEELGGYYCTLLGFEDVEGMRDKFCAWGERKSE